MLTQTVFVAGATGALGSHLVPFLVSRHYRVFGLTRSPDKAASLWRQGAVPVVADAFDTAMLSRAMRAARPDVVVHILTDLPRGLDPSRLEEGIRCNSRMRRDGTASLVAAARSAGVSRMVGQSIAWAYAPGNQPHTEESALDVHAEGLRAVSVAGIVALENAALHTPGLDGVVLRLGHLYGPGTGSDDASGNTLSLHVHAATRAIVLAIEMRRPGIYNIVGPNVEVAVDKARRDLSWEADIRLSTPVTAEAATTS